MKRWSATECELLLALRAAGKSPADIARSLPGRTAVAVYYKLRDRDLVVSLRQFTHTGRPPSPAPHGSGVTLSALDAFLRKPPPPRARRQDCL